MEPLSHTQTVHLPLPELVVVMMNIPVVGSILLSIRRPQPLRAAADLNSTWIFLSKSCHTSTSGTHETQKTATHYSVTIFDTF
jgi:hypothetical protein